VRDTRLGALAVLHPFPSFVNAALVTGLFLVAGGNAAVSLLLGAGMLCLQFSIGAVNDVVDTAEDEANKPAKPIVAGLITRERALRVGLLMAGVGLSIYAAFGSLPLLLAIAMLGCGLGYDLRLKQVGFGWLCYAIAFPLLPLSSWLAATGGLPPRPEILLPVAAMAGPALQLANGLVDIEGDRRSGIPAPVVRLGSRRSLIVLALLLTLVYGLAWTSVLGGGGMEVLPLLAIVGASCCAIAGVLLSGSPAASRRERGWQAQAVGIALLAGGWLAAVV
jgi:4-hydroxybenzoate polyprenyltransferase